MFLRELVLKKLAGGYAVVHLPLDASPPLACPHADELWSVTRSSIECSVVCHEDHAPDYVARRGRAETGWSAFYLEGPIPFGMTGIIARLTAPLAEAEVGCFVISTFDSDFILVKSSQLPAALAAWADASIRAVDRTTPEGTI